MITEKQKRFVELYLANGLNATKAYIEAGYSNRNGRADTNASNCLKKPDVVKYLEELQSEVKEEIGRTKEDLLNRLWDIALTSKSEGNSIKASETINKMNGWNASEKKDIKITSEQPLFGPLNDEEDEQ